MAHVLGTRHSCCVVFWPFWTGWRSGQCICLPYPAVIQVVYKGRGRGGFTRCLCPVFVSPSYEPKVSSDTASEASCGDRGHAMNGVCISKVGCSTVFRILFHRDVVIISTMVAVTIGISSSMTDDLVLKIQGCSTYDWSWTHGHIIKCLWFAINLNLK